MAFQIAVDGLDVIWSDLTGSFVDKWHDAIKDLELLWNDFKLVLGTTTVDVMASIQKEFKETFSVMANLLADMFDLIGEDKAAKGWRGFAKFEQKDFEDFKTWLAKDAAKEEQRIKDDAAAAQAAREAGRGAARQKLADVVGKAAQARMDKEFADWEKALGQQPGRSRTSPTTPSGRPMALTRSKRNRLAFRSTEADQWPDRSLN